MLIKTLLLSHFRNHTDFFVEFEKQILLLIGRNTSGKTNILEAVNVLTFGKSKRCESEIDLIQKKFDHASIKAEIANSENFNLQVIYFLNPQTARLQKKLLKNNLAVSQLDFAGNFLSVSFFPEDLKIISDSPATRRMFLNNVLVQTDEKYRQALLTYEKAIRNRNKILEKIRDRAGSRQELEYWDNLAINNGEYLTKKREEFINFINVDTHRFGGPLRPHVIYDRSEISPARLAQYAPAEIAATSTLVGPHRDDLMFMDNKRNLKTFGSRGEQRLLVLFLKLKELEYIECETREKPVLLLDDIFSELDRENRRQVLDLINGRQTVITTADEKEMEGVGLQRFQKVYLK